MFNTPLEVLVIAIRQEKKKDSTWGRKETKLSLYAEDVVLHLQSPEDAHTNCRNEGGGIQSAEWAGVLSGSAVSSCVCVCVCVWVRAHAHVLSRVQLFVTPQTVARQAPLPMDSPGKNTEVGCHVLLQGIFPTQGWDESLCTSCAGRQIPYP